MSIHKLIKLILFLVFISSCKNDFEIESESGTFIDDRDGQEYKWIEIDEQIWMAENLAYDVGDGCWAYDNDESNVTTYGRLYTWEAAKSACPSDWRLPTDEEWEQLAQYVSDQNGGYDKDGDDWYDVGKHLKAVSGWYTNKNGTDNFGFSGLPGGYRSVNVNFSNVGRTGIWWSATEFDSYRVWFRVLHFEYPKFTRDYSVSKVSGFSIRCVRD